MFDRVLNMSLFLILNIPGFWICQVYRGFLMYLNNFCLNMPKYAWMCLNIPEWYLFYSPCYSLVWRNTRLFSWIDKIWFFYSSWSTRFVFCFRLNIFTTLQITLFTKLRTKLISEIVILIPRKALWASLKLLQIVKNHITNVKKFSPVMGVLVSFAYFFSGTTLLH